MKKLNLFLMLFSILTGVAHAKPAVRCENLFTVSAQPADLMTILNQVDHADRIDNDQAKLLISQQDKAETMLNERLLQVVRSNNPPKKWGDYIDDLPASIRRKFSEQLLANSASNKDRLVEVISQMNPTEGQKDAVIGYLSSHVENELFNETEITKMFPTTPRFNQFFDAHLEGGVKIKPSFLVLAVKTHVKVSALQGLDSQWINPALSVSKYRQKLTPEEKQAKIIAEEAAHVDNRAQLAAILGFSPVRLPKYLTNQVKANFQGQEFPPEATGQVRGVIVQGNYDRDGFALTETLGTRRGMAQVETDIPQMVSAIKDSLTTGVLSKVSPLDQRLFVNGWSLNSSPDLIQTMRVRALEIAKIETGFTSLRIEIHAFPNADVLYRTKKYVENYKKSKPVAAVLKQFEILIQEIEALINPGSQTGTLETLIQKDLKADKATVEALGKVSQNYNANSPMQKIAALIKIRQVWKEKRLANPSRDSKFFYYIGDRKLSSMVVAESSKVVNGLPPSVNEQLRKVSELSDLLLQHIALDDMLEETQIKAVDQEIAGIAADVNLSDDKKLELMSNLLGNTVDQVYYLLTRNFGEFDEKILHMVSRGADRPPVRFVDGTLRSNTIFMLSQMVDSIEAMSLKRKNVSHQLNGHKFSVTGQVFNPGQADGIIRVNANPLELTSEEIGVFSEMPIESGALNGIITLGVGARLSHLQLLAKALQIPNVKFAPEALKTLQTLEGRRVRLTANKDGSIQIDELGANFAPLAGNSLANKIVVPVPDYRVDKPISFKDGAPFQDYMIAGPKGMILMKLFNDKNYGASVKDGFMLPFGFYRRYLKETGILETVEQLAKVKIQNKAMIAFVTAKIRKHFETTPVPAGMFKEVWAELVALQKRTGHQSGYFFRSDTNIEDLPGFNGAGLNESVANVAMEPTAVDHAIREVWASAFKEKSIMWRARALNAETVPVADPSEVVLPTVYAVSSGVILSKGGDHFEAGKGMISANWGIGSVVEAGAPTEEINQEGAVPHRYSFTSSNMKPTASAKGGLVKVPVQPGLPVLTPSQIADLTRKAQQIEQTLGQEPKGWDIEWAVDEKGKVIILQARPVN